MRQILERIDVMPNQVLLEATIAEVRLTDELSMGLRWFFQMGNHQLKLTDSAVGAVSCPVVAPGFFLVLQHPQRAGGVERAEHHHGRQYRILAQHHGRRQEDRDPADRRPGADHDAVGGERADARRPGRELGRLQTRASFSTSRRASTNGRVLLDIEQEVTVQ